MSGLTMQMMIEALVAVLLLLTIGYCALLNRRLKRLRADEASLKEMFADLTAASDNAERATSKLQATLQDCERNLGERLRTAERFSGEIGQQIKYGEELLARIVRITDVATRSSRARSSIGEIGAPPGYGNGHASRAHETISAAQAIANRTRERF